MVDADIVVVGAGPAGMTAACTAAEAGASVVLLDEQSAAGGQIFRAVERMSDNRGAILGGDYGAGRTLVADLEHPRITRHFNATVWRVDADGQVCFSVDGHGRRVRGHRLILATGALERPMPIPGWTLPGAMTAGAAQILLKSAGIAAANAVLAGAGPLLYLLAQQLIRAGRPPRALVETQQRGAAIRAARHWPGAARDWRLIAKGAIMLRDIRRARIPRFVGASALAIQGTNSVEGLTFTVGARTHRLECTTVLLHQGVVPNIQITRALRLDHAWDGAQRCFRPQTDDWGRTSVQAIYVAGDGAGIAGAPAAALQGQLAALDAVQSLGFIDRAGRDEGARSLRRALDRTLSARPFLDAIYAPSAALLRPDDATVICRCEEVTAGEIRNAAALGCIGPNQTKAFTRCGMGPCQGRYCGLTVTEILSEATGRPPEEIGYYRLRAPLKPIALQELADLAVQAPGIEGEPVRRA